MRKAALALLLSALGACSRAPKEAAPAAPAPPKRPNLVSMPSGGSVVSRTAELDLQHSAVRLIDTANGTAWVTPADDT
ncbi:MAG TPA: hypothetical protein VF381_01625, partial [Thermoanaerobaculia bacterium]